MVSTVDGKAALGGSAAGIGSRTDARLMRQIRAAFDAVIWGAGTLHDDLVDPRVDPRRSSERVAAGREPQPLAVTVTGALTLSPTNRFLVNGPGRTVVFTVDGASPERRRALAPYATIVAQPGPAVDLAAALRHLHEAYGARTLLAEGGPTLNQRLLDAGLIDEIFWTLAPKLAGGHGRAILDGPRATSEISATMELVSLFEHESELFARYRLRRGPDGVYATRG
jgi:riboflavin-specific deaminase-like protein